MTAILVVDGVLRNNNGEPIPEGLKLFRTLVVSYRVVLSCDDTPNEIDHWLKTNYVFDYGNVLDSTSFYEGQDIRLRHLDLSRADGKVELYVDADPDMCAQVLSMGIPTIFFSTPSYFKASREIKPWDTLTQEQENQKKRRAENYTKYVSSEGIRFE
jgi:hypothetical protein